MEPFNEFYSYYSGCGIHIKELHKTTKTTISSIRVAAPCPPPLLTKEKRFSFVGEGCGYRKARRENITYTRSEFKPLQTLSLFFISVSEFPGIELLRIVPKSGYNSPQDSVVLVVVVKNTCIWSCSDSEVY